LRSAVPTAIVAQITTALPALLEWRLSMAEPGDPHSPQDGAPQGPDDADLFRDDLPATPPQSQRPTWAAPVRPASASESAPEALPEFDPHAHDDLIGFTSPASLAGTDRELPKAAFKPEPEPVAPEPVVTPSLAPEPLPFAPQTGKRRMRRNPS
jgi:hypothetical protein